MRNKYDGLYGRILTLNKCDEGLGVIVSPDKETEVPVLIPKDTVPKLINDLQEEYREELELYNITCEMNCKELNFKPLMFKMSDQGPCLNFIHKDKEYYAIIGHVPFNDILFRVFYCEDGIITDCNPVVAYTTDRASKRMLIECIEKFCGEREECDQYCKIWKKGCADDGSDLIITLVQSCDKDYVIAKAYVDLCDHLSEHNGGY